MGLWIESGTISLQAHPQGLLPRSGLVLGLFFLLSGIPPVRGAGPCSAFQPRSCNPACDSSCHCYTFTDHTSSATASEMPFALSVLNPGGQYCDLQGEDKITQTMTEIPFVIGPNNITELPWTINLTYRRPVRRTRSGPACPPPPPPKPLEGSK